jgi:cytochrome b involved in lipid metabolism
VNKWKDDDDDLKGFGLLDGEVSSGQKKAPISKKSSKTRHQRAKEDWTPADVASEFSWRIYDKVRGIPNMINTKTLTILLAKNRKEFGITASMELELLDKFIGDERNLIAVKRQPSKTINIFLVFITNNVNKLSQTSEVVIEENNSNNNLIATDGKVFDNTIIGRAALERHEAKLGRQ